MAVKPAAGRRTHGNTDNLDRCVTSHEWAGTRPTRQKPYAWNTLCSTVDVAYPDSRRRTGDGFGIFPDLPGSNLPEGAADTAPDVAPTAAEALFPSVPVEAMIAACPTDQRCWPSRRQPRRCSVIPRASCLPRTGVLPGPRCRCRRYRRSSRQCPDIRHRSTRVSPAAARWASSCDRSTGRRRRSVTRAAGRSRCAPPSASCSRRDSP